MLIFNRWGQQIYSWNNIKGFWDGRTSSGSKVPDGTYFYIVSYDYYNNDVLNNGEKKGGFSLIR